MSFISEAIKPLGGADISAMGRGEPGLPEAFDWRGRHYPVGEIIKSWKTTNRCQFNGVEQYVRKHWFTFQSAGQQLTVYFDRQPRNASQRSNRWILYSME